MKSIMQSIKPQYCELIAAGRKTYEVRKTRPKIETPFKSYIYQTWHKWVYDILPELLKNQRKVIGEYICDEIIEYTTEFYSADNLFQGIWKTIYDEETEDTYGKIVTANDFDNPDDCDICKMSCLSFDDIKNYVGYGDRKFYAYHITNLKIYDEPKALSEFRRLRPTKFGYEPVKLTSPPQSWYYVEGV